MTDLRALGCGSGRSTAARLGAWRARRGPPGKASCVAGWPSSWGYCMGDRGSASALKGGPAHYPRLRRRWRIMGASWGPDDTICVALANRTASIARAWSGRSARGRDAAGHPKRRTRIGGRRCCPMAAISCSPCAAIVQKTLASRLARSDRPADPAAGLSVPSQGRFAEPGWLLFMTPDEVLMAQRLEPRYVDVERIAATGGGIGAIQRAELLTASFDVSRDGRVLIYAPAARSQGGADVVGSQRQATRDRRAPRSRYRVVTALSMAGARQSNCQTM